MHAMQTTSSRPVRRQQAKENESGVQLTDQELAAKIYGARDPCAGLGTVGHKKKIATALDGDLAARD
jgi:hypothetical protein